MRFSVEPDDLAAHGRAVQALSTDVSGAGGSASSALSSASGAAGDAGLAGALGEAGSVVRAASLLAAAMLDALGRNSGAAGEAYRGTDAGIAGGMTP